MITKSDKSYLNCAKNISKLSDFPRVNIGCVLVSGHRIISSGYNSNTKTYPIQAQIDKKFFNCECNGKLHAETMTLLPFIKRRYSLSNATLFTYREKKDGSFGMARPCQRCMEIIRGLNIKNIVYTTDDGVAREKLEY